MKLCEYCGQELVANTAHCSSCGTPTGLVAEPGEPPKKSKAVAVILALIFGPLGLLYLGLEGMMAVLLVLGISVLALPLFLLAMHNRDLGLLISLLVRVACVWYALKTIDGRNVGNSDDVDAEALLDEATKLENVSFEQAIAKYQEVVEKYPKTSASKVANTCLATLRSNRL